MSKLIVALVASLSLSAMAEVFKLDTEASTVKWKAGKKVGSFHDGTVKVKGGQVEVDKKGNIKGVNVAVDMASISNNDIKDPEYQKKLIGHLASEDFFKVKDHPEATFELTSVAPKKGSKDEFTVKGKLTMIGKTEAIEFPAKITKDKDKISGTATVTIDRLKWGIQYGSGTWYKELTVDKIINDSFDLTLNLVAKKI